MSTEKPKATYIFIPCPRTKDGMYSTDDFTSPYGFHHIRRLYDDGSSILVATVEAEVVEEAAKLVADHLAQIYGATVEIRPKFYKEVEEERQRYIASQKK